MISAEQFKSGAEFTFKGSTYSAELSSISADPSEYFIANYSRYCGNVKSIGKTSFTMYTFVMGKYTSVRVPFSECMLVEAPKSSEFWFVDEDEDEDEEVVIVNKRRNKVGA